jgi:hypothetical protein
MEEKRDAYKVLVVKYEDHLKTGVDERIILKCVLEIQNKGCGMDSSGPVAGSSEHSNEPSDFAKCWKFIE